jgi:2-dehydro-3-deoxyphosphogluconate aldolase/(4S)-4-hydroxy-2-oxoglutarate aldolase
MPGPNIGTVEFAVREGTLIMAGALTPTEVIAAWEAGADFVKIFPCGQVGGAKYIKTLKGPLPQVPLVPTGGVNLNTAAELIEAGAVAGHRGRTGAGRCSEVEQAGSHY